MGPLISVAMAIERIGRAPEAGKRGGIPQQAVNSKGEPKATNRGARNGRERSTLILTRLFYSCY